MTETKPDVLVLGTGSQAKVVIDTLLDMERYVIIGCVSGDPNAPKTVLGFPVIGNWESMRTIRDRGTMYAAMGVGGWTDNTLRRDVFEKAKAAGFELISVIHPSAVISRSAKLGEGAVVLAGAIIQNEVVVGKNVVIYTNALIGHEKVLEDHVLISAGVHVGGRGTICEGALLAVGSTAVPNITIGKGALVAAGAVVVGDVPAGKHVFGVPAKEKRV